ncbi:hypothetical protein [Arthrobacter sp. SO3]|uniref:hypothetical protein n=1 Tax=Arthrobacter sp. SO3 TaxID=1897057 RepID=UPI001CFFC3C9|nr:hypothetical protein [Arthrobacter sp. SO3]MCB5293162.1 hypothetical protein [Arthrobacter sp. SO3]
MQSAVRQLSLPTDLGESMDRISGTVLAGAFLLAASSCAMPGTGTGPPSAAVPQTNAATAGATTGAAPQRAATPSAAEPGNPAARAAGAVPEARFENPDYYAMPGQTITFYVPAALPGGVSVAQYEWDFDGDGTTDQVGPLAVAKHSYPAVFEGRATVRINHFTGGSSTASAAVHIGRGPRDGLPAAPVNVSVRVTAHADGLSTVQISWEPGGPEPYRWGVTVDGFPAGVVEGKERTATMTDVRRARDVEIGVVGFTESQGMGASASVTLPALAD